MYKLDNNVAWTQQLKNAFKHNVTRAKITYTENNQTITIDENTGIKELTLEDNRYVPEIGFIGQATAKKLTLILLDNEQTTNLENKEFTLSIGADYNGQTYYITYGNFIVNEPPQNDDTNGTIKIIAYDYMIKFNKTYIDTIQYPCSLKLLLENICTQAGVQLGTEHFPNELFLVENNQFQNKSLRVVLQNIAKSAFNWARIGQDNKLYLDFQISSEVLETLTMDDYKQDGYKKANEYYGPVNKVTFGDSNIQGQEESVQDDESIEQNGKCELIINDNYFAYTTQKRNQLIQAGTVLFGFTYMPIFELQLIGQIYLDCTDAIKIKYQGQEDITSRVFSHVIKYNGIISNNVFTDSKSKTQEDLPNRNTTAEQNSRTEISVDRANKKIESIVEEIGDRSEKTTTITQDIDSIEAQVKNSAVYKTEVEGYTQIHLEDAEDLDILRLEIDGNAEYKTNLVPSTNLYPASSLQPNMEGSELR